jgi:hypothetical protein
VSESARSLRLSTRVRGVIIGALIAVYYWLGLQPEGMYRSGLIIAGLLQVAMILVRRFVPAEKVDLSTYVCEMLADGATVFLFALGVYGSTVWAPTEL